MDESAVSSGPEQATGDLPSAVSRRWRVQERMRRVFEQFGYRPIETPVLSRVEAVAGKYGPEAEQMMCVLNDAAGNRVSLPYDLTVPLVRYVAANAGRLPVPFKRYQVERVWRATPDRPGEFKEYHRCDIDIIGSHSLVCEAEICRIVCDVLTGIGVGEFAIRFGENGVTDKVDFARFVRFCERLGVPDERIWFDPALTRELDYYRGIVFEISGPKQAGGSLCAGGRYEIAPGDNNNGPIVGVGVSFDLDRVLAAIGIGAPEAERDGVVLALVLLPGSGQPEDPLELYRELIDEGISAEFHFEPGAPAEQLTDAARRGIPFAIRPANEPDPGGTVTVIRVDTGREKVIPRGQLTSYLKGYYETR